MLKLLFAFGLLFGPLYRLLSATQNRAAKGEQFPPAPLLHFSPRFTMITRVDVPVNSRNMGTKDAGELTEHSEAESRHNGAAANGRSKLENGGVAAKPISVKLKAAKKAFLNSIG